MGAKSERIACQRRTIAGVQDEAKHAIRAMSSFRVVALTP
jgi:hypothetical protein